MSYLKWLLFFIGTCAVYSQTNKQVAFRELTVEQGLSQNSVVSIVQDSIGFMWFATQDGLNKYNGREFSYYKIQFEDVTRSTFSKLGKLYVDKSGKLWAIANSGKLQFFNKDLDSFQSVITNYAVSTVFQDDHQNFYMGTFDNGLYKVNSQSADTIQFLKPEHAYHTIYDFIKGDKESLLAATKGGVFKIKNTGYEYIEIDSLANFSALAKSDNNTMYLGSFGKGLFVKSENENQFAPFKNKPSFSLPNNLIIQDLLVDKRNRLWIATYGQGAFLVDFKNQYIQNFKENKNDPYALHYNDVISLYEDNTGTIWLGTDGAGLSYYDEFLIKFNVLTNDQVPQNVHVDVIRAIAVDDKNNMWLGTSGKGLTVVNTKNQTFQTYTAANSNLLGDRIMSLYYDKGNLWIGHQTYGLQKMDASGKITSFQETEHFTIWKILKDRSNNLWLGTRDHGFVQFNEKHGITKQINAENTILETNNIRTMVLGEPGIFWIGTETDGLYKFYKNTDSLVKVDKISDKIKSLFYHDSILWVGTNGNGLKSFNTKRNTFNTYSTNNGLLNDVIYGILPGNNDFLWLSSNKGITKLKMEGGEISEIENYDNYDGLQAYEFNTGASYKHSNGILYFGGLEGLNWFNPNQLELNPIKPKTIITNLEVFNKPVALIDNQEFKHDKNTLTFTFSALHYSQPERNQYKYQLINNDANWINSGNSNVAHYTNLPPNVYQFQVISSNYDGVWNTTPATYIFTILDPWYATNLAKTMYVFLIIILLYILYLYLKWRWNVKNQLRLEQVETIRLKKLDEFKTKLYTNISHEFRTPLTLISGPIDNQLAKPELSKTDKKELTLVKQNATRLLNLVNQMLDLSMIDSGQIKLKVSQGNLTILLKQIISAFQYKANKKSIEINYQIHHLKAVWFDKDIIEKITSNLLSNAIKYAPKHSDIIFQASNQEGVLVLSIINTSNHVGKEDLNKLFQRFYQNNELSDGVGVGLALVRDLVTLSKGSIIANNLESDRIQFTVSLPLNKDAFTKDERQVSHEPENFNSDLNASIAEFKTDKPSLLIVEDELDIRSFIVSVFANNYQIIEASNGKIGIEKARKHLPDLIISDIMMPEQDGITLCHDIKTNALTSHIPVILLTAKVGDANEIEGIKTGADAYVTKPFSSEKLKIRVEKLIESRFKLQKHFSNTLTINPELAITSTETEFLKRLQTTLDQHITNPDFNSEGLSKQIQISRTQLHRKLKAITGMTTSEFLRSQRLKLSLELLKTSDATMAEIAYQVGFNSPSYFTKCFKDVYGCTPNEYLLNI
ncbi:two-component regulator propeller domain-containing protein [Bizionia sp.]|uniref:two-component regulator propeller domain-containing protein n=1 Tax=Bizionia sp. TaxID=1954480 RepID=UPI003A9302E7